jgi:septum formation protein
LIPLVLASASPRRKALLEALGATVEIRPIDANEISEGTPEDVVLTNAVMKRDTALVRSDQPEVIIAADTIVVLDDAILGKPRDVEEGRSMLTALSDRTHQVITGVAVSNTATQEKAEGIEITEVTFCPLTSAQIDQFIEVVNPLDRAGGYTIDGPGTLIVERYSGCYQNVLGLPMVRLNRLLQKVSVRLEDHIQADRARFL